MDKSPDAFRTISEVADSLETPAHVLRFWESRFPQIKPVKRAGGRRYYRPADVALLGGIRHLLHDEGMTIRGVQKILREQGVRHVAAMAPGGDLAVFEEDDDEGLVLDQSVSGEVVVETATVLTMDATPRREYSPPEAPAEVVHLHAPLEPAAMPDLSEGFMLPTANRRPLPTLDPEPPSDDVPEAGHVWVEDEDEGLPLQIEGAVRSLIEPEPVVTPDLFQPDLFTTPQAAPAALPVAESPVMAVAAPNLAGLAARLRALPHPVVATEELTELQMRLGLLQAQMIEALRARR